MSFGEFNNDYFNDRALALAYIKERGYVSHSSLKRYINGEAPTDFVSSDAQIFGKELHSRFLENKKIVKLSPGNEIMCKKMLTVLRANKVVCRLLQSAEVEQEFKGVIKDVQVLGYYDIISHGKKYIADLKTTRHTTMANFVQSLDFLQPAIYLRASGFKDFYFIGITKSPQPKTFVFNVREYPDELKDADKKLCKWLAILKKEL